MNQNDPSEWFRCDDDEDGDWRKPVGDGSIDLLLYEDEVMDFPPFVAALAAAAPSAPVVPEPACIAEGHWFHGPNGSEHDPDEGPCEFPAESTTTTTHLTETRFTFDGCGEHLEATRHDDGSVTIANDHGAVSLPNDDAADFASWLAQACPRHELERLRRWKAEATLVLNDWEKVYVAFGSPGLPGDHKSVALLAEIERRLAAQPAPTTQPELPAMFRDGCCAQHRKPCTYHEGYRDGWEIALLTASDTAGGTR